MMGNENTNTAMSWDHPDVKRYEKTFSLKIPGYFHLYDMTDRLMTAQLHGGNSSFDVLIVGAGGGQEIVTLGSRHESWTFTGIDPSAQMLGIAKSRTESVADAIYRSAFPSGVYHIEQLFELENLQGWLQSEASIEIHIEDNLYK